MLSNREKFNNSIHVTTKLKIAHNGAIFRFVFQICQLYNSYYIYVLLAIICKEPWKTLGYQGKKSFLSSMWPHGTSNFGHPIFDAILCSKTTCTIKLAAFKCDPIKTYLFDIDKNTFIENLTTIWKLYKIGWEREKYKKFKT